MVDATTGSALEIAGPGTYPLVAWSEEGASTYCVEGSVITAGAAVQWLRDGLGVLNRIEDASRLAESVPDTGGVWAVPAFQGLGTPIMQAGARGMIGGLSRGSSAAQVARALLEGIAHRVADVAEAFWHVMGAPAALRVDGGASRNDFLLQAQADWLGMPVERSREPDSAALGVASMAARGAGIEGALTAIEWRPERRFDPRLSADQQAAGRARWHKRLALAAADGGV
jgi:glycerol kinase